MCVPDPKKTSPILDEDKLDIPFPLSRRRGGALREINARMALSSSVSRMNPIRKYIKDNVFCRCGRAVSRLVESELIARPDVPSSEVEVREWWLVSADLAARLRARLCPVVQFHELWMWGREATGIELEDDRELIAAIESVPPSPEPKPAQIKARRARRADPTRPSDSTKARAS